MADSPSPGHPPAARKSQLPPTDPDPVYGPEDMPPGTHPLDDLDLGGADVESVPTELLPLDVPDGAVDDLPPGLIGHEELAADESDVIRGLVHQPPAGSSNIFDPPAGGSSRFTDPEGGTDHLNDPPARPSNDVLYAELVQPSVPSSMVFAGGGAGFDPAGLGDGAGADARVSLGLPAGHDASSGMRSSIFADGSAELRDAGDPLAGVPSAAAGLPFDAGPAGSQRGHGHGAADPDAIGFDLPRLGDDDAVLSAGYSWALQDDPRDLGGLGHQPSGRAARPDAGLPGQLDALDSPGFDLTPIRTPMPPRPPQPVARPAVAPVVLPPARATGRGWLAGGAAGALAGAGATAAAAYFGGLFAPDAPPPVPQTVAAVSPAPAADPGVAAEAAKSLAAARADVTAAKAAEGRVRQELAALKAELDRARRERTPPPDNAVQVQLLEAKTAADKAQTAQAEAEAKAGGLSAELAAAKAALGTRAGELKAAADKLAAAEGKATAADAALAKVVADLKANSLAADADDPAAALAKLPAALKTAATASLSADAQRAAAVLAEANRRADAARAELATARQAAADAATGARQARAELAAAQTRSDDRAKAAVAEAEARFARERAAAQAREATLRNELEQQRREAAEALARKDEEHRLRLADARSGVAVPLSTAETRAKDAAAADLNRGLTAYFEGRPADALAALTDAVRRDPDDARSWYFLGLSRWRMGDNGGADLALRKGADLERKGRTSRREVNDALQRVQGQDRDAIRRYRP